MFRSTRKSPGTIGGTGALCEGSLGKAWSTGAEAPSTTPEEETMAAAWSWGSFGLSVKMLQMVIPCGRVTTPRIGSVLQVTRGSGRSSADRYARCPNQRQGVDAQILSSPRSEVFTKASRTEKLRPGSIRRNPWHLLNRRTRPREPERVPIQWLHPHLFCRLCWKMHMWPRTQHLTGADRMA